MGAEQLITEGYYLSSSTSASILFRIESFLRTRPALLACILILLPAGLAITAMATLIELIINQGQKTPKTRNDGSVNNNITINEEQENQFGANSEDGRLNDRCSVSQLVLMLLINAAGKAWDELMNESDESDEELDSNPRPYYRPRYEYIIVPIDPPCPLNPNSIARIPVLQYHEFCSKFRPNWANSVSCTNEISLEDNEIQCAPKCSLNDNEDISSINDEEIHSCMVCLSPFHEEIQQLVRVLPRCHHVFHVSCIDTWFATNSACPLCRLKVTIEDDWDDDDDKYSHGFNNDQSQEQADEDGHSHESDDIIVHVNE